MKYFIWDKEDHPLTAPVAKADRDYFKKYVLLNLTPITETDYMEGFLAILHSLAKQSYILFDGKLYWLIEWDPGLIVLEFNQSGTMRAVALRSPIPCFGGREPLDIDNKEDYDEDAENHQYNLIFDAWDAQFDLQEQKWRGFKPAREEEQKLYFDCLKSIDKLGDQAQAKFEHDLKNYYERAKQNIDQWAGTGIITR